MSSELENPTRKGEAMTAKDEICNQILEIMETYAEQDAAGGVDTPGGLEHMGDVWNLFSKWERKLKLEKPNEQ